MANSLNIANFEPYIITNIKTISSRSANCVSREDDKTKLGALFDQQ